jgi:hypothetical protein
MGGISADVSHQLRGREEACPRSTWLVLAKASSSTKVTCCFLLACWLLLLLLLLAFVGAGAGAILPFGHPSLRKK